MNRRRTARQAGFTIIELITVIVILGILSATAMHKMGDFGREARIANLKAAGAAMQTVSAMVHGKYAIAATPTVTLEDVTVNVTNGYPKADVNLLLAAGLSTADYQHILTAQDTSTTPRTVNGEVAVVPVSIQGNVKGDFCYAIYTEATATVAARVTLMTRDC